MKKKHDQMILTICLFLIFFGIVMVSHNFFMEQKLEVFNQMNLKLYSLEGDDEDEDKTNVSVEVDTKDVQTEETPDTTTQIEPREYIATLQIPAISLRLGLVSPESKYNDINYNIAIISPSTMPDVEKGNLIIAGHSGTGYLAFFRNLYKLQKGAQASVVYQQKKYTYRLVNIYFEEKTGYVSIYRDINKKTLTLITCTKDNDKMQTVYIFEEMV